MKIAVTGYEGGLVRDRLVSLGVEPIDVDILDEDSLNDELQTILPDVVIHAAAMTDVDRCELDYKRAFQVNVRGTMYVAEACNRIGARMVYLSTCHVFDGTKKESYSENSRPNPKNAYGFTKWTGEVITQSTANNFLIVRISKLFGSERFRKYLDSPERIDVPTFMFRNYTHVNLFCDMLLDVIKKPFYNGKFLLNLGTSDSCSSFDFFQELYEHLGIDTRLIIPRGVELASFVFRPNNGSLDMSFAKRSGLELPTILDGILLVKKELGV